MNEQIEVLRGLVAIDAALSHIGPRRPDPKRDPEDAEMWDGLQSARAALAAMGGQGEDQKRRVLVVDGKVPEGLVAMVLRDQMHIEEVAPQQPEARVGGEVAAEDRFEQFVQQAIANSPEPLRELGEYLSRVLDEDEFPKADRLLLQLATAQQPAPVVPEGMVPAGWQYRNCHAWDTHRPSAWSDWAECSQIMLERIREDAQFGGMVHEVRQVYAAAQQPEPPNAPD